MTAEMQQRYHDGLFVSLQSWETTYGKIADLSGDASLRGLLGLDQLGHFGSHGADMVVDAVATHLDAGTLRILELGSGYGGVLRYVSDALTRAGQCVERAVGVELLFPHVAASSAISRSVEVDASTLVADAHHLPFAPASFDLVYVCGSAAHFPDMERCLRGVHRVLRPGGIFVMTEEVSLLDPDLDPAGEFIDLHPPDVFSYSTVLDRCRQLTTAGFRLLEQRDLAAFAADLLDARSKALKLFRGTSENVFGVGEVARLAETLAVTRAEIARGSVTPAIFVARPRPISGPVGRVAERVTFDRSRRHLSPGLTLGQKLAGRGAYESTASGAEVTLSDGRTVLDFSSYAVMLFGHRPPRITAAVHRSLDRMPTSTRTLCNPTTAAAAERLLSSVGADRLERVWFGLNGSDVVDCALKLARLVTGRSTVAAVEGGFHGKSTGALAATWSHRYRSGLESSLAPAVHLPLEPDALALAAAEHDIAAFIVEPIQGEGGVRPIPAELLAAWRSTASDLGIVFIADEIQTGFGRCGSPSLIIDAGLDPDVLLLGKPIAGGVLPLSAMLATAEVYAPMLADPFVHSSTFSGHPASCAAALAAMDELAATCERVTWLGEQIEGLLADLVLRHPLVLSDRRGRGALWGLTSTSTAAAGSLLTEVQQAGLLVSPCLGDPEVLRLLPPSTTTRAELVRAMELLDQACCAAELELDLEGAT